MTVALERKRELDIVVREHPMGSLAAALGLGYLVGGGLFTRTTGKLLSLGWALGLQLAVVPALENALTAAQDERR